MEYKRVGECKNCGNCCRNIQFVFKDFNPEHRDFYGMFKNVTIQVIGNTTFITLLTDCKHLGYNKDKTTYCEIYEDRPERCRMFPWTPKQQKPWCGYRFREVEDEKKDSPL